MESRIADPPRALPVRVILDRLLGSRRIGQGYRGHVGILLLVGLS